MNLVNGCHEQEERDSHRLRKRVYPERDGSLLKVPDEEVAVKPSSGQERGGLGVETQEVGLLLVAWERGERYATDVFSFHERALMCKTSASVADVED